MIWQRYKALIIGCGLAFILAIVGLVFMFKLRDEFRDVKDELKQVRLQKKDLESNDPYPNNTNNVAANGKLDRLNAEFTNVLSELQKDQIEREELGRADFPLRLEETLAQLTKAADAKAVALPENFAFGFKRYKQGALPKSGQEEDLLIQLKTVRLLAEMLITNNISAFQSLSRGTLEQEKTDSQDGGRNWQNQFSANNRDNSPTASEDNTLAAQHALYKSHEYVVSFRCSHEVFWTILNRLVEMPQFVVVRNMTIENSNPEPVFEPSFRKNNASGGGGSGVSGMYTKPPRPHDERIVAGREHLNVTLSLEFLRFKDVDEIAVQDKSSAESS